MPTNEPTTPPEKPRTPPPADPPKASEDDPTVGEHGDAMFPYAKKGRVVDGERMPHKDRWKHASASALHCWPQHAHHEAKEMRLSADDYKQAIEAACKLDDKGHVHPHEAALYAVATPKA